MRPPVVWQVAAAAVVAVFIELTGTAACFIFFGGSTLADPA